MDVKIAIANIFQRSAGMDPGVSALDRQDDITEEIDVIRSNEDAALLEASKLLALCQAGIGAQETGVDDWENGAVVLLDILSLCPSPAARLLLEEIARSGGDTVKWRHVRAEAQRLTAPEPADPVPTAPVEADAPPFPPVEEPLPSFAPVEATPPPFMPSPPFSSPPAPPQPARYPQPFAESQGHALGPAASPRQAAGPDRKPPIKGLLLPVVLLLTAWLIALADGTRTGVCPNAILCVSVSAYCLLLGVSMGLMQRRRIPFGLILLVWGAFLSALTLGWAKLTMIGSDMGVFAMFGVAQFWLDFLIALIPAALTVLCALLPRIVDTRGSFVSELLEGLLVCVCCAVVTLLTLPRYSLLAILFTLFMSLIFGAFACAAALFTGMLDDIPRTRIALGGAAAAWFAVCIAIAAVTAVMFLFVEEHYLPLFAFPLLLVQIVMLIRLLFGRRGAFLWYCAASAAVLLAGLMYFMLAFVLSQSWLPIAFFGTLLCAVGPSVGYVLIRKRWRMEPAAAAYRGYAI